MTPEFDFARPYTHAEAAAFIFATSVNRSRVKQTQAEIEKNLHVKFPTQAQLLLFLRTAAAEWVAMRNAGFFDDLGRRQ
jgi:hypothetical protein